MKQPHSYILSFALVCLNLVIPARATTFVWTNVFDSHWSFASNWSPQGPPGPNDTAIITNGFVIMDIDPTISNLVSSVNVNVNGHTLTIAGTLQGVLLLNGGVLAGKSGATIVGTFGVSGGGRMTGSFTIATNGTLYISSGNDFDLPGCSLTNNGSVVWTAGRIRTGGIPGTLILNNGLWDCQCDQTFNSDFGGDGGAIVNAATFRKSSSTNSSTIPGAVSFASTGTVDVQTGALVMSGGAQFVGGTVTGPGVLYLNGGGIQFNAANLAGNVQMAGGGLYGQNTIIGALNWYAGSWNSVNWITISNNSVVNILSDADHDLAYSTLVNYGTITWTGGRVRGGGVPGTVIYNYGLWDAQLDQVFNSDFGGIGVSFYNYGTLRKSGGKGASTFSGPSFVSTGLLETQTGWWAFNSGAAFTGGTITGAGLVYLAGGGFNLTGTALGNNVWQTGGALYGTNTLNGTFTWSGGAWNSADSITISSNSIVNVVSTADHDLAYTVLTNNGSLVWTPGAGRIRGGGVPGTTIYNNSLWDCQCDQVLNADYGGNGVVFNNSGTFRKSAASGTTTLNNGVVFNSTGVVDVESGGLLLSGGGTGGAFNAATNTTINFNNGYTFVSGSTFTGAGSLFLSAGNFVANGTLDFSNLSQTGGTLFGGNIIINGSFNWYGGTWNGASAMTISTNSQLNILTGANHDMASCTLSNFGTVNWVAGNIRGGVNPGSFVHNFGLWDCQCDQVFNNDLGPDGWVFNNRGIFRKSAGTGNTTLAASYGPPTFRSTGLVDIRNGSFVLNGGGLFTGGSVTGTGFVYLSSGGFTLNGATLGTNVWQTGGNLVGTNVLDGTFYWNGGLWTGASSVTVPANGILNIVSGNNHDLPSCTVSNFGTVNWTGGNLRGGGNSGTQVINLGLWDCQSDQVFNSDYGLYDYSFYNSGTLRKSGAGGTTTFGAGYGPATFYNAGTIDIRSGSITLNGGATFTAGNVIGAGLLYFNGGNFNVNGTVLSPTTYQTGGNLVGTNFFNGSFNWYAGSWGFANRVTVPANSDLTISSGNNHDLPSCTLSNLGRVHWQGGNLRGGGNPGTLIVNQGLWDCQCDQVFNSDFDLNGMVFDNLGTFRKSASTGTTTYSIGGSPLSTFSNSGGGLEILSGTLSMPAGLSLGGGPLTFALGGSGTGQAGELIGTFAGNFTPGPLNVFLANNFLPAIGSQFPLISTLNGGSYSFPQVNLPSNTTLLLTNNVLWLVVSGQVTIPTSLLSPSASGGLFSFSFQSQSNLAYTVEHTDNLLAPVWVPDTNLLGNGLLLSLSFPTTNSPQRFYRVRQP